MRERIDAFNHGGGLTRLDGTVTTALAPVAHPFFGATGPTGQNWLGARTTIQRWYADPLLERSWDGDGTLGNCAEYLDAAEFPILGICAGHQFMARHFGGKVQPSKTPEFGQIELSLCIEEDSPFKGVPTKSIVWESHNDEVTHLPVNFITLGESENCKIQAMRHRDKHFYGLQFHPEVEHTQYGERIFQNFIGLCEE